MICARRPRWIAAAAFVLLAACAKNDPNQTRLKFWTIGREGEVVQQLLPEFERTHPGVRIDVQQIPLTAAHEKLLTAFAGDALPDMAQLGNTWLPEFVSVGALEPLQQLVDQSAIIKAADYFPGIWDTNVIDGIAYGVPWYVDTRLIFYRTDLLADAGFSTPPATWDEWATAMAAVKQRQGEGKFAVFFPLNEFEPLLNLALQQSDPLLKDNDTLGNFQSPGFRRSIAFYAQAFRNGWAPKMSNTELPNIWDELARGFVTFYVNGPWNIGEFERREPELKGRWSTAPLPGTHGPGGGAAGGSSLVIFHSSTNKQIAWELSEFLSRVEQQEKFYELTGDLPPRRSVWESPALAQDEYVKAFRTQLELVKPTPKVPEWERITDELAHMQERVARGGEPIDQALKELDARADKILEKRRWMLAHRAMQ
ncbi:MAG: sugar ABC transporter substrate-binding protein [Rudaea sp.]